MVEASFNMTSVQSVNLSVRMRCVAVSFWDRLGALLHRWRAQEEVEMKAASLLRSWLTAAQRSQFDTYEYFDVLGCDTGKRYRIRYGISTNVYELDERGRVLTGGCFQPAATLAAGDVARPEDRS